jgi:hypothetical protein
MTAIPPILTPLDPLTCPNRIKKAETILRNRTDRISIVLCEVLSDINSQPILRTADALGIQEVYNLTEHTQLTTGTMVQKVTKGSHAFLTLVNYPHIGLFDEPMVSQEGSDQAIRAVRSDIATKPTLNPHISILSLFSSLEQLIADLCGNGEELWYITNSSQPSFYQFDSSNEFNDHISHFLPNPHERRALYDNHYFTLTSPTSMNDQSFEQPLNFFTPTQNSTSFDKIVLSRVPIPLNTHIFGSTNAYSDLPTLPRSLPRVLLDYQQSVIQHVFCNPTAQVPTFEHWHTATSPSTPLPTTTTPLLPFPPRVFLVFDSTFSSLPLQLAAHKHVYIPLLHHQFSPSNHAAIYVDRLLSLCPSAIGNLSPQKQAVIRPLWFRRLATTDAIYTEFLKWAAQPENIPLLSTLRLDILQKWWTKTASKAGKTNFVLLQGLPGSVLVTQHDESTPISPFGQE